MHFQMLPGPTRAKQSTLRLCKSILKGSWKHLQLWRCVQTAMGYNSQKSQMLEQLRPLCRSVGDFESSWDLCTALQKTWCHILTAVVVRVPQKQGISSIIFIFVTGTRFATSYYGMYYLSMSLCIYTYSQSGCRRYSSVIREAPGDCK